VEDVGLKKEFNFHLCWSLRPQETSTGQLIDFEKLAYSISCDFDIALESETLPAELP
jgi:hypothetical protein